MSDAALRANAIIPGQELTYTCVPAGSGPRLAIDRDQDGFLDGDERDARADPADAASTPPGNPLPLNGILIRTTELALSHRRGAASARFVFTAHTRKDTAANRITLPPGGTAFDPTRYGAALHIYGAAFTLDATVYPLPAGGWRRSGRRSERYRFRSRDAGGSPIRSVLVARDQIRVRGRIAYTLDEPAQGKVAVRLVPGLFSTSGWCAAAPARRRGRLGSTARSDRPGRFVGAPKTPPPATCPPLP